MRITIEYESSWLKSFLDGSNNESLPRQGRNFIGSMTALGKEGNFKTRAVTKDTVMGYTEPFDWRTTETVSGPAGQGLLFSGYRSGFNR